MPDNSVYKQRIGDHTERATVEPPDLEADADDLPELDVEASEADAVDQHRSIRPQAGWSAGTSHSIETPEADAAEQARIVSEDEDEYR